MASARKHDQKGQPVQALRPRIPPVEDRLQEISAEG